MFKRPRMREKSLPYDVSTNEREKLTKSRSKNSLLDAQQNHYLKLEFFIICVEGAGLSIQRDALHNMIRI